MLRFIVPFAWNLIFSIFCSLAGMSRSVTIVIAYIMSITTLRWNEALKVVRGARAVSNPNSGFQKQLQEFESTRLIEVIKLATIQTRLSYFMTHRVIEEVHALKTRYLHETLQFEIVLWH